MKELASRVKALLRRPKNYQQEVLRIRNIELNPSLHTLTKDQKELKIYPKDFALLQFLLRHPNKMFSAEELLNSVWRSDSTASVDTVRQCLMRLRKLLDEPGQPSLIRNVHGVGYKIEP
jgi:two-component system OmpR family response regulator